MKIRDLIVALSVAAALSSCVCNAAFGQAKNQLIGTWAMVSATAERQGVKSHAYGPDPHGWLVFTSDLTFIEVLTDPRVPKFASEVRGEGTDEENRAAMAGGIGFFGRYTVDQNGQFSGNTLVGSTFPNWVGAARTSEELQLTVEGDRMVEDFLRPDGTKVHIIWQRVR